jgi:hypothetical protein
MSRNQFALAALAALMSTYVCAADPPAPIRYWNVDDIRPGMTGHGLTVLKGTKPERFEAAVLGVIKNFNPGQDLVLARLSGAGLEATGVISGMSGSPVYIAGKLVGAIAYTWPFNTEPIAGITPFAQMMDYSLPRKSPGSVVTSTNFMLDGAVLIGSRSAESLAGEYELAVVVAAQAGVGRLARLQTPVIAAGLSAAARDELNRLFGPMGLFVVEGGAASAKVLHENSAPRLEPGGAMAVGMVTGDVSMTAIGTITAVDSERIYGFGHPFFGAGACEMPLLTAFIHAVVPKQTISSKMGSALVPVGRIDTDVSTCVAGRVGKSADLVPVTMRFRNRASSFDRTFRCEIIRDQTMLGPLAMSALASCGTLEGQAPIEMTARMTTCVEFEGFAPLIFDDVLSGSQYSGSRGLIRMYGPIANLLTILSSNPWHRPRIVRVECATEVSDQRRSAEIVGALAHRTTLEPGDTLHVDVLLRPYAVRGVASVESLVRAPLKLRVPESMRPGKYVAMIGDGMNDFRNELANRRHLGTPTNFAQLYEFLKMQLALRHTEIVVRVNVNEPGVAIDGAELPNLPTVTAELLGRDTARRVTPVGASLVARAPTDWTVEGVFTLEFEVVKQREFYEFAK